MNAPNPEEFYGRPPIGYFAPHDPITNLTGNLPHWRQDGVTYFVTFRLADSLPAELLVQWREEVELWCLQHPEPHDRLTRADFYERFPARFQQWLDAGSGSCVLAIPEVRSVVEQALHSFERQRYSLDEFVVAPNHVHMRVTPIAGHELGGILHSWKSFTAHELLKIQAAVTRIEAATAKSRDLTPPSRTKNGDRTATHHVWQKESFDHIVRSPANLERFREYIRTHKVDADSRREF